MRFIKSLGVLLVVGFLSAAGHADDFDKKVVFTMNQIFVVPGAQYTNHQNFVPAGTYSIRFMNGPYPQTVAYLFDKDDAHLIATAIPIKFRFGGDRYTDGAYDKLIQFSNNTTKEGYAILKYWLYPGDDGGWEFVGPTQ